MDLKWIISLIFQVVRKVECIYSSLANGSGFQVDYFLLTVQVVHHVDLIYSYLANSSGF